ncbi:MAG: hypothetical protein MI806_01290, partial [Minwuiales bacterium]|nr:hypothetical protein [Minwuiales bacterium]
MTVLAAESRDPGRRWIAPVPAFWFAVLVVTVLLSNYGRELAKAWDARWMVRYPSGWKLPIASDISAAMKWLVEEASFGL